VRFARTDVFKADYRRLSNANKELFRPAAREFNQACDQFIVAKDPSTWPAKLRVKPVTSAPGVFEMTWSFTGPDGRATWEWTTVIDHKDEQHPAVLWRRLGDHKIFRSP